MSDQKFDELLLSTLARLEKSHERIEKKVDRLSVGYAEIKTEMKIKGGVWGLIGGAIPAIGALAFWLMKGHQ